ncbi:MAG: hypothetical protein IT211_10425 [Armatimonadetes bacterium]|nr:hypothetical protein [Armatimonadota bacterium]
MQRRILFISFFLLLAAGVVIYGVMNVDVPQMTFAEAVKVNDESKKVILVGKGINRPATEDGAVVFYVTDMDGTEVKVSYDGEAFDHERLNHALQKGEVVHVAGHAHSDHFHGKELFFK